MHFAHAITRTPGDDFAAGITSAQRGEPHLGKLLAQHASYEAMLRALGLQVRTLPPLPGFADAYFVEDAAVVLPETAVLTRPGAHSRRGEPMHLEKVLARERELVRIEAPGTLDGGDVLVVGREAFIGESERTNHSGATQLQGIFERHGYACTLLEAGAGLHLKSSVSQAAENTLLITAELARHRAFARYRRIELAARDAYAANALYVNGRLVIPAGYPQVAERLAAAGLEPLELDVSEPRKMDGGLTCLSLRF